jgi:hypothetical protein
MYLSYAYAHVCRDPASFLKMICMDMDYTIPTDPVRIRFYQITLVYSKLTVRLLMRVLQMLAACMLTFSDRGRQD